MAVPGFIARVSGRLKEILAIESSSGSGDADKIVATGSDGKIDISLLPSGTGPISAVIDCTEDLAAGDLINVYNSSGKKCRKADADSAGKQCHGFVLSSYTSGDPATVYFNGMITGLTGLTPGSYEWLGTTAGATTETPPTGSGVLSQIVGVAVDTDTINFECQEPVELAA